MLPFNIGPGELILILVIGLVVLGPGKLPDVASSLGKSVREFRKAATDVSEAGKLDGTPVTSNATPVAQTSAAPVVEAAPAEPTAADDAPAPIAPDETAATAGTAGPARDSNVS